MRAIAIGLVLISSIHCPSQDKAPPVFIQRPNAMWSMIFVDGKPWPDSETEHARPREFVEIKFKGHTYFAILSGPYDSSNQRQDIEIFEYPTKKVVSKFSTIKFNFDLNGKKLGAKNQPWDGRTWTADFDKCELIEDWTNRRIPMNLDSPSGFFPDQKLGQNIPRSKGGHH